MRIVHELVLDNVKHEIRIDGLVFPYYVAQDVQVLCGPFEVARLGVEIFADVLTVIDGDGRHHPMAELSRDDELAWAARRGREIVLEGLADVIAWLGESRAA